MVRLQKMTFLAFQTSITGMPQMEQPSTSCAAELVMSLAPTTSTASNLLISGLISSISKTHSCGTPASARRTFIWPGMRPATGWMPNTTLMPPSRHAVAISPTQPWARATAMPYPGTIRTSLELARSSATLLTLVSTWIFGASSPVLTTGAALFMPPKMTFKMSRFMASHMIFVRMAPLQPMREPTTVSTGLFRRKPSATSAQPE
mmetsp:Transcript_16510/g.43636  ORF Transcript_16510/g.43636 Transcript_16510/m.43636 type:complete len:205 (-) Transcript_16510:2425-3039(-)